MYFYQPAHGHGLPHNPFNALVAPRPIGWIGTHSASGVNNLATFSFFNALTYNPPLIGFSSNAASKHTLANAEATGEFTWNLVSRHLWEAMNETSTGDDVDEFERAGLTPVAGQVITAPRVAESRVSFECRVSQIVALQGADGSPAEGTLVVGEVVGVHIDPDLLVDGVFDTAAAEPVMRGGGPSTYFTLGAELHLRRPQ